MLLVLFLILILACALAPLLATDTSDSHSERSHPVEGWYPPIR